MSRTTRRSFVKRVVAASAVVPIVVSGAPVSSPAPEGTPVPHPLAEALVGVVRAQSGQYLDAADMERIRSDFRDYVSLLDRLRGVKLSNADEPDFTFASLTKRWS